jgi:hypothetical protein
VSQPDVPRGTVRAIDVLGAMSLAADLALGLPVGHGVRATYIGMCLAGVLGIAPDERVDVYYAGLLMDAGCTAWTTEVAALVLGDETRPAESCSSSRIRAIHATWWFGSRI